MASEFLLDLRGTVFRKLADAHSIHVEGLSVAARVSWKRGMIDGRTRKRLVNLEDAIAYIRHATKPGCIRLLQEVVGSLERASDDARPQQFPEGVHGRGPS